MRAFMQQTSVIETYGKTYGKYIYIYIYIYRERERERERERDAVGIQLISVRLAQACPNKYQQTYLWSFSIATARQLSLSSFWAVTSAPLFISTSAAARWPFSQARNRGVCYRPIRKTTYTGGTYISKSCTTENTTWWVSVCYHKMHLFQMCALNLYTSMWTWAV